MKQIAVIISLLVLSLGVSAQQKKPVTFKGIACEGKEKFLDAKPFLMITNVTESSAVVKLQWDDEISIPRSVVLDVVTENGKKVVGYLSEPSNDEFSGLNFAIYTNGSTPQDTTKGILTIEGSEDSIKIEMECWDGMNPKESSAQP